MILCICKGTTGELFSFFFSWFFVIDILRISHSKYSCIVSPVWIFFFFFKTFLGVSGRWITRNYFSIDKGERKNDIDHNNNFERFRWLYMLFLSLLGVVGFTFVVFFIFSILTLHLPRMPGTFRVDNFISHYLIILYFGFCKLYNLPQS